MTKEAIKSEIDTINAYGGTNFEDAFNLGLTMLKNAQPDQYGDACASDHENIIIFLTDGKPTVGVDYFSGLKSVIDAHNINITLLAYGLGNDVN